MSGLKSPGFVAALLLCGLNSDVANAQQLLKQLRGLPLPPTIQDSRGNFVGYLPLVTAPGDFFGLGDGMPVLLNIGEKAWAWSYIKADGSLTSVAGLYYESVNCTGTSYISPHWTNQTFAVAYIGRGPDNSLSSVYYGVGAAKNITIRSVYSGSCFQAPNPSVQKMFEAKFVALERLRWVAPYSIAPANTR